MRYAPPRRAGEAGEKNGARKSEPARGLFILEFPAFADERSDPIGSKCRLHNCDKNNNDLHHSSCVYQ